MNNMITELEINNFKSIKHIKMDCKRINVLIGRPNVGKSNILEALALYTAPYCDPDKKIFSDYIRYEKLSQLFYNEDRKKQVIVKSNLGFCALKYYGSTINAYDILITNDFYILNEMNKQAPGANNNMSEVERIFNEIVKNKNFHKSGTLDLFYSAIYGDEKMDRNKFLNNKYNSPIKKYQFKPLTEHKNHFPLFLNPPFGDNLYTILENDKDLYKECNSFFRTYGLDLLINPSYEKLEVQKVIDGRVYPIPYSLSADTLQRYIFHLAAIETNTDSILLFEEPESHSFPAYISLLAEKIIENKTNQFFIATHSPDLLMTFMEQSSWDDVAIFIVNFENYETNIKALSNEELQSILDNGIDLFFNLRAFA